VLKSFSSKEKIIMSEKNQVLDTDDEITVEQIPYQSSDDYSEGTTKGIGLTKIAIGALIGATLGAVAGALATKGTAERLNQTVKGVGNAVKRTAEGVNGTVQDVGNATQTVAYGVNDTVKDVGNTVKNTAESINDTVKGTVDVVKGTVDVVKGTSKDVNDTVKGTVDTLKNVAEDVKQSANQDAKLSEKQRTYILVPVDDDQSGEPTVRLNAGTSGSTGETA
jgi:gas vesicle protein